MVLARQRAIKGAELKFQRQGLKVQRMPRKEIVAAGDNYLAEHRAELIAEAIEIVKRWHAEGMFGKRGGIRSRASCNT